MVKIAILTKTKIERGFCKNPSSPSQDEKIITYVYACRHNAGDAFRTCP